MAHLPGSSELDFATGFPEVAMIPQQAHPDESFSCLAAPGCM